MSQVFIEKSDLNGIPVRSGAPLRRIVALRTESVPEIKGTRIKDLYVLTDRLGGKEAWRLTHFS